MPAPRATAAPRGAGSLAASRWAAGRVGSAWRRGCRRSLRPGKGASVGRPPVHGASAWRQPSRSTSHAIPSATHERFMRLAIEQARRNPAFPFGAVIVRMSDEQVMAEAVNEGHRNPDPARRGRGDPRLCRAARPPRLGRDGPLHHRRALPDVHERHHLGRHRRCGLGHLDRDVEARRLRSDRHRLAGDRRRGPVLARRHPRRGTGRGNRPDVRRAAARQA